MQYSECIEYLEHEVGFASRPGLERIRVLCDALGNPERRLSVIHIAGTNGKGSAAAMLSSILKEAGYRVGTYTSPHLERYNERFLINSEAISDEVFAEEVTLMRQVSRTLAQEGQEVPTLFELLTGAAFHYFLEQKVDVVVLEVGLGGAYDATNVVPAPLLSLIMSISMDHTNFLGDTIEKIAAEKAGIIKKNCPVVLYSQDKIVYNIVERVAAEMHAPLFCPQNAKSSIHSQTLEGTVFSVEQNGLPLADLFLPLLGSYQIANCITVLEACAVLRERGLSLSEEAIRSGLQKTRWAGRMEICGREPLVLLDGAHNADGILQLANSLSVYFGQKKLTLLLGVLGDKEYQKMTEEILPFADTVVLTEPQNERRLEVSTLAHTISHFDGKIYLEKDIAKAYESALAQTKRDGILLCCGSLYMIGAIKAHLHSRKD